MHARQPGQSRSPGTGLSPPGWGWGKPHMPLAPLAEVTLGLRNTPIRITTIPSSGGSVCSVSSISSNVTKVSAGGAGCCGAVPHLGTGWGALGLGAVTRVGRVGAGSTVQNLWLVCHSWGGPRGLRADVRPQAREPPVPWAVLARMQMQVGGRWSGRLLWVSACFKRLLGWQQLREKPVTTRSSGPWLWCWGASLGGCSLKVSDPPWSRRLASRLLLLCNPKLRVEQQP